MIDEQTFDRLAAVTLDRVVAALDEIDPDLVEAVPSMGVVRLEFNRSRRSPWILNTQRGALQMWLAAERTAWHFAHAGGGDEPRWVAEKSGDELFSTLQRLLREHEGVELKL